MVESHQKNARECQKIVRGVRLLATQATQGLEVLLFQSPVMMGIGAQVLVSTARVREKRTLHDSSVIVPSVSLQIHLCKRLMS